MNRDPYFTIKSTGIPEKSFDLKPLFKYLLASDYMSNKYHVWVDLTFLWNERPGNRNAAIEIDHLLFYGDVYFNDTNTRIQTSYKYCKSSYDVICAGRLYPFHHKPYVDRLVE